MATEIIVPALGESVTTATVARWIKQPGQAVLADEPLVELETDKVTVEVNSPCSGVLASVETQEGAEVAVGAVLGLVDADKAGTDTVKTVPSSAASSAQLAPVQRPAANPPSGINSPPRPLGPVSRPASTSLHSPFPAAAKLLEENAVSVENVGEGTGKDGRITKGDVLAFLNRSSADVRLTAENKTSRSAEPGEQRIKMTRLRRTIASRLKEAQNSAAMLTTFNEVDMTSIMTLRATYREDFERKHKGIRLGFMSMFVRACCAALKEFPAVNAEIDGDEIIYKNFVHMGIAVGGPSGLVVPVIRNADRLGFAAIEAAIGDFGKRARDGALKLEELAGGSFSITNGGIYGSLMSTPILNPPQSAILGMHKIQERPVAINGKIEIRPMMYVALSYDHRIIDGKEAVSFLVRVKETVEDPRRLLLEV